MKTLRPALLAFGLLLMPIVHAADNPADAITIVQKGASYLAKNGKDALLTAVNSKNPDFIKGDIYLFVMGVDGTILAHPVNPKLVGKNLVGLPDGNGKLFRQEMIDIGKSKGKGWVDYSYNNPETKQVEQKATYLERHGDLLLEAGIYKGK